MKRLALLYLLFTLVVSVPCVKAQTLDEAYPVRGFCIAAPLPDRLNDFIAFIKAELTARKVNTLILRVDYNYKFSSHPELRDKVALSKTEVKKIVKACKDAKIRVIPQINLLGHQSWAGKVNNLLAVYPDFDETPHVKMPENYEWPNADGLYCKSYCPLHPKVHKVVFDLVDEICDVFEADAFHAGMDEVFYIGHDSCSRCSGRDKAELFAGEVRLIRDHLAKEKRQLWIWGDRLIDGRTTGLGMWEASYNNTFRAVDMIPKDVMICDWHYERADPTPVYFAMKGFDVVTCPWRMPQVAQTQAADMVRFRMQSSPEMKDHFKGMMQTVWSDAGSFLDEFTGKKKSDGENSPSDCFRALYKEILKYNKPSK
ncbi:MAG TPA: family 20 glycosylhydrolase [Bacteroidales bacterium]|nr:family 20 glycosylhydrolase [Bacteroidales bacterium]